MKNKLITEAKKRNIDIEIFETRNKCTDINSLNDTIKLFQISDVTRYKIKAIKDEKCIQIITESLKNTKEILDSLEEIFLIQDNENKNTLCHGTFNKKEKNKVVIDFEEVKDNLKSLNDLKKEYPCIKNIEGAYSYYENARKITNNNCNMNEENYFNSFGATITIEKDNITRVLYLGYYTKDYDFQDFKNYLLKKLNYAIVKLDSKSVKTNKYRVLLTNNVVSSILATFADSFQSKKIFLKESVFTNKTDKKIFSDKINIIEDSQNGIKSINFDSEGTLKICQTIVKNGVFVKELNNLEYANITKKEPTGNADGVNNLYIEPGVSSYEELIKKLNNGIIIDEAYGFHAGVDKKTGVISVQAEGILVENGKLTKGLNMIILSTNIFEVFTNVCEVGKDLNKEYLAVAAPSLLLENITIAGKE